MSNRLLRTDQFRHLASQAVKEWAQNVKNCKKCQNPKLQVGHTCGAVKLRKKEPEDLSRLTDEALEGRIFYSQDARSGEPFGPLWDEYKRRYHTLKLGAYYGDSD